jgi:hypothetical protein
MEFKGKFYKGDYIYYLNRNNVNFINKQMDCFTKISKFNNTSIGNVLILLNHSDVITDDQKNILNKVLSYI